MNADRRRYQFVVALCAALMLVQTTGSQSGLFVESASTSGLTFTHVNGAAGRYYMPEVMGAGVALFDYDNDGDLDVFLVQVGGTRLQPRPSETTLKGRTTTNVSQLFRNDLKVSGGRRQLRFTDVTGPSGLGLQAYGMGTAVGDYDNDGDLDLLVTSFGPETLFRNNGDGTFADVTKVAGVTDPLWSTSASFLDYDRDGDLDLFVANYLDYCTPRAYKPVPDRLYRNEGNGTFADVSEAAGISKADGAGLGVTAGDYNGDGWLDLYVANDGNANQLWLNQRNGTFVDEGLLSGSAVNAAGNPEGSMGIASGDFDADGDDDLFITNIVGETFALYVNDGKGTFEDARVRFGLAGPTAAMTGFGTDWFDYDNDGWLDLFAANGAVNIVEAQRGEPFPYRMKNQLFRNLGSGRFEDTSGAGGPARSAVRLNCCVTSVAAETHAARPVIGVADAAVVTRPVVAATVVILRRLDEAWFHMLLRRDRGAGECRGGHGRRGGEGRSQDQRGEGREGDCSKLHEGSSG